METLIIHPEDKSTSFLNIVYEPIENKTVITKDISKNDLKKLMVKHDRIMMMGHGSPIGLFDIGVFKKSNGFIIDSTFVDILKERNDSVFIWCNADKFVEKYDLKGFYSGMFISEVIEAHYCGLFGTSQGIVDESNYGFTKILSKCINESKDSIYRRVKKEYGIIAKQNPVALFNQNRLYKN